MMAVENGTADVYGEQGDVSDIYISLSHIVVFFQAAMIRCSVKAQDEMARGYAKRNCIRKNVQNAVELYRQTASRNDTHTLFFFRLLQEHGNGFCKNCDLGLKYYGQ